MADRSGYEKALELVEELNPAAQVLSKAQQLIREPNVRIEDLERLLRTDPAIAADIIRVSNSPYYSCSEPSQDLNTSITRLGSQEILKLIGLAVSKSLLTKKLIYYNMSSAAYWSENVSIAIMMEVMGKLMSQEPQKFYTVGLLSGVGKIVVNQILEIFSEKSIYRSGSVTDWEKSVIGFDHAFAGAMILKRWEFPSEITNVILHQYKGLAVPDETPVLRALCFARKVISQTGNGFVNDNLEIDQDMDEFLSHYFIDEDELINGLVVAAENYQIIKAELEID